MTLTLGRGHHLHSREVTLYLWEPLPKISNKCVIQIRRNLFQLVRITLVTYMTVTQMREKHIRAHSAAKKQSATMPLFFWNEVWVVLNHKCWVWMWYVSYLLNHGNVHDAVKSPKFIFKFENSKKNMDTASSKKKKLI